MKSIPKITLTGVKTIGSEDRTNSNSKTGVSVDSQLSFNKEHVGVSADDLNELRLLDTYDENSKSTTSINRPSNKNTGVSGNSFGSNMDIQGEDMSLQNVESRFPEINLNADSSQEGQLDTSISTTGNVLQVNTGHASSTANLGDIRRSKSMKADGGSRKRFSVNNPFPTLNKMEMEKTGDSIISFEDIKDNLIKFDTAQPSLSIHGGEQSESNPTTSKADMTLPLPQDTRSYSKYQGTASNTAAALNNNTKSEKEVNSSSVNRGANNVPGSNHTSRSALNLPGGYRRLSSEQLAEEIIDFSDDDSL